MSCEKHCKQCEKHNCYELSFRLLEELKEKPVEYKQVSKFAWFPIRDPESKKLKWLRLVTLYYETQIYLYDFDMFPRRRFVLVKVEYLAD